MKVRTHQSCLAITSICQAFGVSEEDYVHIEAAS